MNHECIMIYLRMKWPSLTEANASYDVTPESNPSIRQFVDENAFAFHNRGM